MYSRTVAGIAKNRSCSNPYEAGSINFSITVQIKSCTTNLLEFMEMATKAADEGLSLDVVFLDFAKAFDQVPKKRLLKKLEAHGIGGHLLAWIEAWLTGREQ